MFLLCMIGADGGDDPSHVMEEMRGSGIVLAACGYQSKSLWRIGFRDVAKVVCEKCRRKTRDARETSKASDDLSERPATGPTARPGSWSTRGLFIDVPDDSYNLLRTMIAPNRTIAVIVPATMSNEERDKAITELDSIAQALRRLG